MLPHRIVCGADGIFVPICPRAWAPCGRHCESGGGCGGGGGGGGVGGGVGGGGGSGGGW